MCNGIHWPCDFYSFCFNKTGWFGPLPPKWVSITYHGLPLSMCPGNPLVLSGFKHLLSLTELKFLQPLVKACLCCFMRTVFYLSSYDFAFATMSVVQESTFMQAPVWAGQGMAVMEVTAVERSNELVHWRLHCVRRNDFGLVEPLKQRCAFTTMSSCPGEHIHAGSRLGRATHGCEGSHSSGAVKLIGPLEAALRQTQRL